MEEHDSVELGSEFEFGPGTDLMLSMLAFVLVLLAGAKLGQSDAPAPVEKTKPDNVVELRDESLAIFENNSARLTPEGANILREKLNVLAKAAPKYDANVLRVKGFASPLPRPKRLAGGDLDSNLDLSSERSTEIAHALHVLGLPYACLVVEGYGRSRSLLMQSFLKESHSTVEELDKQWLAGCDPSLPAAECTRLRGEIEKLYAGERMVKLVVTSEPDAPCTHEELQHALDTAARAP